MKKLLITFLRLVFLRKYKEPIVQSSVSCDVILDPKMKFLEVGDLVLFKQKTVFLGQEMQILKKLTLITFSPLWVINHVKFHVCIPSGFERS